MKLKQSVLIFSVLMLFAFMGFVQAAQIEKGPYLIYEGDNTEMTVLWQLDATDTCTLEWGTNTTYSTGSVQTAEYGSDHQHKYVIPNLNNATRYYYRVSFGSSSYTGSFRSAPSASAQNVKFFAYGDTRTYPADHDDVANQMINAYTVDEAYRTFTLHVGDWIDTDTESDWSDEFFPRYYANIIEMQSNLVIQGCIGNHEGSGYVYEKYYPYPYVGSRYYWSFDYGPIHVAVIDQYTSYSSGSTQYNWLVNDLASTGKKWIFLLFHEPGWSAGGHSNEADVQNYIQPLCTQYGVDIVFCGHNHYYARCVVEDIQHVTTGGGGAPLYSPNSSAQYLVESAQVHHHCEIDIQGNQLDFVARRDNGSVVDSFTLIDNSGPQTPVADFTANATTISVGQSVNFTDQSTNTPTSWSWTFDGGSPSSSTAQNPSVTYAAEGTYNVTLTAANAEGSDVETKIGYITVIENLTTFTLTTTVSGEGTVSPAGGTFTEGTVVNIEAVPSAGYLFNGWSGDLSGSTNPTTITMDADKNVNAAFIFSSGGNYLPFPISSSSDDAEEDESDTSMYLDSTDLEMVDESGSSSNRQLVGLRFTGLTIPQGANITGAYIQFTCDDDNTGGASLTIKAEATDNSSTFTSSSGNISSRTTTSASVSWSPPAWSTIGESGAAQQTPDISSLIQEVIDRPGYSYGNPVTIIITGSGEREAESYDGTAAPVLYIKAESSGPQPPTAGFSANTTSVSVGGSVNFSDSSTNTPISWSWTFTGGTPSSSTTQNPSITYNSEGTYTVSLTVTNAVGSDTETKTNYITVQKAPLVYCSTQGGDYSYEWIENVTVGDIDNTSGAAGYTDFSSITGNLTEGDTISVSCTPGFSGSTYTEHWKIYIDYNIDGDFEDSGEEVFYSISDGTVTGTFVVPSGVEGLTRMRVSMKYDAEQTPCETFSYGEVEDYTVNFIATGPQPPVADFTASDTSINEGQSINFADSSTNNPTSWSWNFTGGTPSTSTAQNPSITYNTAGTYTVELTATNSEGSDAETKTNYITVTATPTTGEVGNTTVFGSTSTSSRRRAMPFTMPEDGTITSVTMYHTGGSGDLILAVYDGSSTPQNRLAITPTVTCSGSTGWQTVNLSTPVFVSGGSTVWLAWVYESNPGIRYQTGSPGRYQSDYSWSGGMPDPFGSGSQSNYLYSIYATYNK